MNKKLIYTGIWLCLGGLASTSSVWADANSQSMKKCPQEVLERENAIFLTEEYPVGHVNKGDPANLADDFYETCPDTDFDGCVPVDPPVPFGAPILENGAIVGYSGLTIIGTNKDNFIEGTIGDDEICGQSGNDTINGLEGNDFLYGNNGNDILIGWVGNDYLYGGNGNDSVYGYDDNEGNDPAEFSVTPDDKGGDFDLDGDVDAFDTDVDISEGGNGTDRVFGGPNHDDIYGGNGNDTLNGGGGDDTLDGGNGKDNYNGGEGEDAILFGKGKDSCTDNDSDLIDDCPVIQPKGKNGGKNGGNKGGKK